MTKKWLFKTRYSDVVHLKDHGVWPDKKVPEWASERAYYYDCSPTSSGILEHAYVDKIKELEDEIDKWLGN